MKLSYYFEELICSYKAEIEDLQSDSEGKNVLRERLAQKRKQFAALMSMIEFAPEMVAPAFHGGIKFNDPHVMTQLSTLEPDEFPTWEDIEDAVSFEPWGADLALIALREPDGERFMSTVVCLEFLLEKYSDKHTGQQATHIEDENEGKEDSEDQNRGEKNDEDAEEDERGLDEAGADWMTEQGFDRHE